MELQVLTAMNYRRTALWIISVRNFNGTNVGNVQFVRHSLRIPCSFENFNIIKGRNSIAFFVLWRFTTLVFLSVITNKHRWPNANQGRYENLTKSHTINNRQLQYRCLGYRGEYINKVFCVCVCVCIYI